MNGPDPWIIRAATSGDAHGIAAVLRECWPDNTPEPDRIARLAGYAPHALRVAMIDRRCVGVVDAFPTTGPAGEIRWEIDLLAVAPVARGRRVGRALISAAVQAAPIEATHARGLVRLDNLASAGAFRAAEFEVAEPALALYLAKMRAGGGAVTSYSHIIPVQTLLYTGLWVEGQVMVAALEAASGLVGAGDVSMAGMLVPAATSLDRACQRAGFHRAGDYRWWLREFRSFGK